MVIRVVEQQGEPVSSGAQPLHGGIQTTGEIWVCWGGEGARGARGSQS